MIQVQYCVNVMYENERETEKEIERERVQKSFVIIV